jgi:hypothetical protein
VVTDSAAWRCPVCEGVNHGGRVCATCGERLPEGFVPRDAAPRAAPAAGPPVVVPVPRPRGFDDIFGPAAGEPGPPEPWPAAPWRGEPVPDRRETDRRETDRRETDRRETGRRATGRSTPPPASFDDIFGPG